MIEAREMDPGAAGDEHEIDQTIEALAYFPGARRGLVVAIESLAALFRMPGALDVIVDFSGRPLRLAPRAEATLCRVVHRSLHNARGCARCSIVRIGVSFDARTVRLTLADDGIGLTETIPDRGRAGTNDVRRLVTGTGGTFRIRNVRPRGAVVEVEMPRDGG